MKKIFIMVFISLFLLSITGIASALSSVAIERVSISATGEQGNDTSSDASVSGDGRYVAFASYASNLVPGDSNGVEDIFVRDRLTGTTTLVSVSSNGEQANGESSYPSISEDGRYIAFSSGASNLVTGDTNGTGDIFVHDRSTGKTVRVSVSTSGGESNGGSQKPFISANGRYVAFKSFATNLVPGANWQGIYVHDRDADNNGIFDQGGAVTTEEASVSNTGEAANNTCDDPSISADGRYVAFQSLADNLVPGDTSSYDIFIRDRFTGDTKRVNLSDTGEQSNGPSWFPRISSNGHYIAYSSDASNLVPGDINGTADIFVYDLVNGVTTLESISSSGEQANYRSVFPSLSADGRYVAFESGASNLVKQDDNSLSDVFVRDRVTGEVILASASLTPKGEDYSGYPSISADGRNVVFVSPASNLVKNDTNNQADVFINILR